MLPKIIRGQNLKKINSVYYKKNKKIVGGRVNVSSYLLSGLIKCGNCGSNFQGHQKVIKRENIAIKFGAVSVQR